MLVINSKKTLEILCNGIDIKHCEKILRQWTDNCIFTLYHLVYEYTQSYIHNNLSKTYVIETEKALQIILKSRLDKQNMESTLNVLKIHVFPAVIFY